MSKTWILPRPAPVCVQPDGSARREALVAAVKRDIENIAHIYPTAFSLYDEPLDRLARRVVATMEAQNDPSSATTPGKT